MAYRSATAYTTSNIYRFEAILVDASATETANGSAGVNIIAAVDASSAVTVNGSASANVIRFVAISGIGTITANSTSAATARYGVTASGSVSASATANANATLKIAGSGQANDSASAGANSTQIVSGSNQVTASAVPSISFRPLQTISATATVVASTNAEIVRPFQYYLVTPITEEGLVEYDPYYNLIRNNVGISVVKRDGVWQSVRVKVDEWLQDCEVVFRGGHENVVTAAQKTELEAAGYTVETRLI